MGVLAGACADSLSTPVAQGEGRPPLVAGDGWAALHALRLQPVPYAVAKAILQRHHYLHSMPGGTRLAFGVFDGNKLVGAVTLGIGPYNAYRLVGGATPADCITLSRFWLADGLPTNAASRVLGIVLRALHRHTSLKFVVTYADPAQRHVGTIYQATGWLYTGLSAPMPVYSLSDGPAHHSRSFAHAFGTRSLRHFAAQGMAVSRVVQMPKHRYLYFLDRSWQDRLRVPVLPYPKREVSDERP